MRTVVALLLFLLAPACGIHQGTEIKFEKTDQNGVNVKGSLVRDWSEGPVDADVAFDPATGQLHVHYASTVSLDAAVEASKIQTGAQITVLQNLASALASVASVAVKGMPPEAAAASAPRSVPQIELSPVAPPAPSQPRDVDPIHH